MNKIIVKKLTMKEFVKNAKGLPKTEEYSSYGVKVRVYGDRYQTEEIDGKKSYFEIGHKS